MKKLNFLQAFRGIAALMIVILHSRINYPPNEASVISNWLFSANAAGVDLFFVISGFIMVYTTKNLDGGLIDSLKFLIKRVTRIIPVYFIITIVFFMLMLLCYNIIGVPYNHSSLDLIKSFLLIPNDFSESAPFFGSPVLHVGWSLNYEMYFYFLIFVSLFFKKIRWILFFMWIVCSLILIPYVTGNGFILAGFERYQLEGYLNIITSPLIWEFVAGIIIGFLYFTKLKFPNPQVGRWFSWVSVTFTCWWLLTGIHSGVGVTHWGLPMVIMVFCFVIASKTYDFKVPKPLIWLGDISFSLYLIHPLITDTSAVLLWETPAREAIRDPSFLPLMVILSLGLAVLSHKYLEIKLSNIIKNKVLYWVDYYFVVNKRV